MGGGVAPLYCTVLWGLVSSLYFGEVYLHFTVERCDFTILGGGVAPPYCTVVYHHVTSEVGADVSFSHTSLTGADMG